MISTTPCQIQERFSEDSVESLRRTSEVRSLAKSELQTEMTIGRDSTGFEDIDEFWDAEGNRLLNRGNFIELYRIF